MPEKFTRVVGANDADYLQRLSRIQDREAYIPEIKRLADVSLELASRVGELGLGEATDILEPIAQIEVDREQRVVIEQAHELRECGQVFLRSI